MEVLGRDDEVDVGWLKLLASDGGVSDDDGGCVWVMVWKVCLEYLLKECVWWEVMEWVR